MTPTCIFYNTIEYHGYFSAAGLGSKDTSVVPWITAWFPNFCDLQTVVIIVYKEKASTRFLHIPVRAHFRCQCGFYTPWNFLVVVGIMSPLATRPDSGKRLILSKAIPPVF